MIPSRYSAATEPNTALKNTAADQSTAESVSDRGPRAHETSNVAWLKDTGLTDGIILLGGTSVAHFRLRVAQAQLRGDLLPSYWSVAGILLDGESFASVPLDTLEESSLVPTTNGVQVCGLADYDDTTRFPNIAVLRFTEDWGAVRKAVELVRLQRSIIDLPSLMLAWLGYIWAAGQHGNPLLSGMGIPSAAFVETAYGIKGMEITPGLASGASCPEAIWQSAKWWHEFYAQPRGVQNSEHATATTPTGFYAVRQPSAAAIGPKDTKVGEQIVSTADRRGPDDNVARNIMAAAEKVAQNPEGGARKSGGKSTAKRRGRKGGNKRSS
jgi:hypothetical protein